MPPRTRISRDFDVLARAARDFAAAQGGVFRARDLAEWGLDPRTTRTMARRGLWVRLHHGLYVDRAAWDASASDWRGRHILLAAAAVLAMDEAALAYGRTAAVLHELPLPQRPLTQVELIRDIGRDRRPTGERVLHRGALTPARIRTHGGVLATAESRSGVPTIPRVTAAITSAAQLDLDRAVAVLDSILWDDPDALPRLDELAHEWAHLRGIGIVRRALRLARPGAQTPLESISRIRMHENGLPEPALQCPIYDADGLIGYADFAWLEAGVLGEADGLLKYGSRADLVAEKRREDRLRALGFVVVRWTWDEIVREPARVIARIRQALATARRRAS